MIEGIPIFCDGWCREYSVDEIAAHLLSEGELPAFQDFFVEYSSLGEIRAGFYAASIIGYIRNAHGMDELRNLWHSGTEDLEGVLGEDLNAIENSWKNYLRLNVEDDIEVDFDTITEMGCG
jgi:hypothetical protein